MHDPYATLHAISCAYSLINAAPDEARSLLNHCANELGAWGHLDAQGLTASGGGVGDDLEGAAGLLEDFWWHVVTEDEQHLKGVVQDVAGYIAWRGSRKKHGDHPPRHLRRPAPASSRR